MLAKSLIAVVVFSVCNVGWTMDSWSPFSFNRQKVYAGNDGAGNTIRSNSNADPILDEPVQAAERKKKPFVDMSWIRRLEPPKFNLNRQNKVQGISIDSEPQISIQGYSSDGSDTYEITDDDSSLNSDRSGQRSAKSLKALENAVRVAQNELNEARRRVAEGQYMENEDLHSRTREAWGNRVDAAKQFRQREEQNEGLLLKKYHAPEVMQSEFQDRMYAAKKAAEKAKFFAERNERLKTAMISRKADAARCYRLRDEFQCDRRPGCSWRGIQERCDVKCESIMDMETCHMTVGIINNDQISPQYSARESDEKLSDFVDKNYDVSHICSFSRTKGCLWKQNRLR